MSDSEFVEGVFIKTVNTKYGEIIKQSFDCEAFINFMRANAKQSAKNGKWYFNAEILTNKEGKKYMKVDTFEPQPQNVAPQSPMQQSTQYQAPPQMPQQAPQQSDVVF